MCEVCFKQYFFILITTALKTITAGGYEHYSFLPPSSRSFWNIFLHTYIICYICIMISVLWVLRPFNMRAHYFTVYIIFVNDYFYYLTVLTKTCVYSDFHVIRYIFFWKKICTMCYLLYNHFGFFFSLLTYRINTEM